MSNLKTSVLKLLLVALPFNILAQFFSNPSFEGTPQKDYPPPNWRPCDSKSTPDTQPGFWQINNAPSNGNAFIGMCTRGNLGPYADTWEDCETELTDPIKAGECYKLQIDLAFSQSWGHDTWEYGWISYNNPTVLRIWGGQYECDKTELLTVSPVINHTEWRTYDFVLGPLTDYSFLILEVYYASLPSYFGNILIDNIRMEHFNGQITKLDTLVLEGDDVPLTASQGDFYQWEPSINLSCFDCQNPIVHVEKSITYTVKIVDTTSNCPVYEIFRIWTESRVSVPDAFTPNRDGINDNFKPIFNENVLDAIFKVYNRWGQLVFQTSDLNYGWDGEFRGSQCPIGTYVWMLNYKYYGENGMTNAIKKGAVSLLR